jgi:hypothetical protein
MLSREMTRGQYARAARRHPNLTGSVLFELDDVKGLADRLAREGIGRGGLVAKRVVWRLQEINNYLVHALNELDAST